MCHTVTGPHHLKVEAVFHMHIVLNATGTAMEFVKPLSNCFSIGAKPALGEPICDHLSCELSGSDGKARKLLDKQQPQWKLESVWAIVGLAFLDQMWLGHLFSQLL